MPLEIRIKIDVVQSSDAEMAAALEMLAARERGETARQEFIRKEGVSFTGPCAECSQFFEMRHDGSGADVPLAPLHNFCVCQDIPVAALIMAGESPKDVRGVRRFEWLGAAPAATLTAIAGPTRAGLIEAGRLDVEDLYAKRTKKPKALRTLRLRGRRLSREKRREIFNKARQGRL